MKKILLLGGEGFIGQNIKRSLSTYFEILSPLKSELDLTDSKACDQLKFLLEPDGIVLHCAAIKRQIGDSLSSYESNMKMTFNLCRSLMEGKGFGHLIFLSSTAIYGEDIEYKYLNENTSSHGRSYYGLSKIHSENIIQQCFPNKGIKEVTILRAPTIYGPDEPDKSYGPFGFSLKASKKEDIVLWGDGSELREFVFIQDLIDIIKRTIDNKTYGTFNICTGKSVSFRDILAVIEKHSPHPLKLVQKERSKRKVDVQFDNSHFEKHFPDIIFIDLESGIKRIFDEGFDWYDFDNPPTKAFVKNQESHQPPRSLTVVKH